MKNRIVTILNRNIRATRLAILIKRSISWRYFWKILLVVIVTTTFFNYSLGSSSSKINIWLFNSENDPMYASNFKSIPLPASFIKHYSTGHNISLNTNILNLFYSSHQCVGPNPSDLHTENAWGDRQCILHNVCLHKNDSGSTYVLDYFYPSSIQSLNSTIIRPHTKLVALRHGLTDGAAIRVQLVPMNYMNPTDPNSNVSYVNGTYLMYHILPDGDMNFGHIIFDDAFGLYANLKQFEATRNNPRSKNHVLVFRACDDFPKDLRNLCQKFTDGIFPAFSTHAVRSIDSVLNSSISTRRICFREVVVGHGMSGAVGWGPRNFNRAQIFAEFRADLLVAHGINPNIIPKEHHILLINKKGRRALKNLHDIYKEMLSTPRYTGIKITVIDDFKNLTITEQLKLFQTATIVLTPCGGISLLFFFLPRQSVLIVSGNPYAGRLEAQVWDYQSHLRVIHYPVNSKDDYEMPPGYNSSDGAHLRNYANTILKTEKLFPLIDRAIVTTAFQNNYY